MDYFLRIRIPVYIYTSLSNTYHIDRQDIEEDHNGEEEKDGY